MLDGKKEVEDDLEALDRNRARGRARWIQQALFRQYRQASRNPDHLRLPELATIHFRATAGQADHVLAIHQHRIESANTAPVPAPLLEHPDHREGRQAPIARAVVIVL